MFQIIQIDDDTVNNMAVERLGKKAGLDATFQSFTDPTDAVKYIKELTHHVDFIILDINMPKLSGWDVLDVFTNINLQIPVFMVTSSLDASERLKAQNHPLIRGFYVKPLAATDLQQMVSSL